MNWNSIAMCHQECIDEWDIDGPVNMLLILNRDASLVCAVCGVEVAA